jgi:ferredoxin
MSALIVVREPECPVDAIFVDADERSKAWNEINKELSLEWPNISKKKQSFSKEEQDKWAKVKDKKQYLSKKPAPSEVIKE